MHTLSDATVTESVLSQAFASMSAGKADLKAGLLFQQYIFGNKTY